MSSVHTWLVEFRNESARRRRLFDLEFLVDFSSTIDISLLVGENMRKYTRTRRQVTVHTDDELGDLRRPPIRDRKLCVSIKILDFVQTFLRNYEIYVKKSSRVENLKNGSYFRFDDTRK